MKDVLTRIAWKNHYNGARNPRAQFQKEVARRRSRLTAHRRTARDLRLLGRVRRSRGGDHLPRRGRAQVHRQAAVREGAVVRGGSGDPADDPEWDYTSFEEVVAVGAGRVRAGRRSPTRGRDRDGRGTRLLHITEFVLMEDLGFAERGHGLERSARGHVRPGRRAPVNPDGGLKSFGHPIGASGLRMLFECWMQLRREGRPSGRSSR